MISAIVINWNGRERLAECLDSLRSQEPAPAEIVVVDNHSDDGSRDFVRDHYPDVKIVDTGANRGPGYARNAGVAAARHELCLLVDNDVVLLPGALAAMAQVMSANAGAAMVQARSLCRDRQDLVHYDGADLHVLGTLVLHNWFRPLGEARSFQRPMGAGIALCFLARRSAFQKVGGFFDRLFINFEDNEFSFRLRAAGYDVLLAEQARCLHGGGTAGVSTRDAGASYPGRRVFLHSRNRLLVLWSCLNWRTLVLTLPAQLFYSLVYLGFATVRGELVAALRGHAAAFGMLPAALRRRRSLATFRVRGDRQLLVAQPMTPNPGLADRGARALLRRVLDFVVRWNWQMVRWACG